MVPMPPDQACGTHTTTGGAPKAALKLMPSVVVPPLPIPPMLAWPASAHQLAPRAPTARRPPTRVPWANSCGLLHDGEPATVPPSVGLVRLAPASVPLTVIAPLSVPPWMVLLVSVST